MTKGVNVSTPTGGSPQTTNATITPGNYLEFKSDWTLNEYTPASGTNPATTGTGTYTVSGSTLSITMQGSSETYIIQTLNSSTLIFVFDQSTSGYSDISTLTFTRI